MPWAAGIRRLRLAHGWKQAVLAERLGVDQATVSRWERGQQLPDIGMRRRLAEMMVQEMPDRDQLALVPVWESPNPAVAFDSSLSLLAVSECLAATHGIDRGRLAERTLGEMFADDLDAALEHARAHGFWEGRVAAMSFTATLAAPEGEAGLARVLWTPLFLSSGEVAAKAQLGEVRMPGAMQMPAPRVLAVDDLCASYAALTTIT